MFGIGMMELILIAVVALVVVGPQKLPDLMKQMGKFFVQVRQMTHEVRDSVENVIHDAEQEIEKEREQKAFHGAKPVSHSEQSSLAQDEVGSDPGHHEGSESSDRSKLVAENTFDYKPGAKASTGFDLEARQEPTPPSNSQTRE